MRAEVVEGAVHNTHRPDMVPMAVGTPSTHLYHASVRLLPGPPPTGTRPTGTPSPLLGLSLPGPLSPVCRPFPAPLLAGGLLPLERVSAVSCPGCGGRKACSHPSGLILSRLCLAAGGWLLGKRQAQVLCSEVQIPGASQAERLQ